eukprot:3713969-Rhodomonas_salina.1
MLLALQERAGQSCAVRRCMRKEAGSPTGDTKRLFRRHETAFQATRNHFAGLSWTETGVSCVFECVCPHAATSSMLSP